MMFPRSDSSYYGKVWQKPCTMMFYNFAEGQSFSFFETGSYLAVIRRISWMVIWDLWTGVHRVLVTLDFHDVKLTLW